MSSFRVSVERLNILPHPNADALELAEVGHFRAVVAKGEFQTGDLAVFIPEQAIMPEELLNELGLAGRLAGPQKNRVKAVRLRGELSQGIVARPELLEGANYKAMHDSKQDLSRVLNITKWIPPVPTHMGGDVQSTPDLLPWVDIENIKRFPGLFTEGEPVTATEKIHGTATLYTYDLVNEQTVGVASKGVGAKSLSLKDDGRNLYWKMAHEYNFATFALQVGNALRFRHEMEGETNKNPQFIGIFGETYGRGIQDLTYGSDYPQFTLFDISVRYADGQLVWLPQDFIRQAVDSIQLPLTSNGDKFQMVPELYNGPYNYETLAELAEGKETVSGGANVREGLVVRPVVEAYSPLTGGRKIGKIVGGGYLTRKGGTEYE